MTIIFVKTHLLLRKSCAFSESKILPCSIRDPAKFVPDPDSYKAPVDSYQVPSDSSRTPENSCKALKIIHVPLFPQSTFFG